jgi:2-octaprenylphenol hydroxylase
MKDDCDIIICGAGLVGSTLAGLLADSGLRIVILESAAAPDSAHASKDIRVSALSLATKNILASIGAWKNIAEAKVQPAAIMAMKIWDAGSRGQVHFDSAEIGEPCLGYIVENQLALDAIRLQDSHCKNIKTKYDSRLLDISFTQNDVTVTTAAGDAITAKLLIGADGANSRVRTIAGIANHGWQYQQTAIVATVDSEKSHDNTAYQRFLATGPLAFLPLANPNQTSIVWSADTVYAEGLLKLNDKEFSEKLGEQFEHCLGEIKKVGKRFSFPLSFGHAESYVDERLALVGDAAHRLHPLAGQGVNMGLLDAAALAEVIIKGNEKGKDIGRAHVLSAYTRWRKQDNQIMLMAMDGFKRVFGAEQPLIGSLRSMAMNMVTEIPPLRRKMMRLASGLGSNLPRAARDANAGSSSHW